MGVSGRGKGRGGTYQMMVVGGSESKWMLADIIVQVLYELMMVDGVDRH
jgi:hypothetical protein